MTVFFGSFMRFLAVFTLLLPLFASSSLALAACDPNSDAKFSYNFPSYSFYKQIAEALEPCGGVTGSFAVDPNTIGEIKQNGERSATLLGVSVGNLSSLNAKNSVRPLDELVAKYGQNLNQSQLIKRNGQIVALALTANTQLLAFHKGIFQQEKLEEPQDFIQLFDVMRKLGQTKTVKKPYVLALKDGWNLANEFINLYVPNFGPLLDSANRPSFNNPNAEIVLNKLKEVVQFIPEDYSTIGATQVQTALAQGEVAMGALWASSGAYLDNPQLSRVSGRIKMVPMPAFLSGGKPSSTLWWDGIALSASSTSQEAEAAFKALMASLDGNFLENQKDKAIWLLKGYQPNSLSEGVIAAIDKGIPEFPSSPGMDILLPVLGKELPKFLKGEKGATQTLIDAQSAYSAAARERGVMN